jgi:hypothetical protein
MFKQHYVFEHLILFLCLFNKNEGYEKIKTSINSDNHFVFRV